jgi:chromosome segregation ATPase
MMLFSRIVTLLAGAIISAVVLRWKDDSKTNDAPWRPELEDLHQKLMVHLDSRDAELATRISEFQPRIEALAAELKILPDGRIDELATRIAQLQPKIEALAAGLMKPDPRMDSLAARLAAVESRPVHTEAPRTDPRVEAIAVRLTAVESRATTTEGKIGELEQKLVAQDQRLQATNKVVVAIEQMMTAKMNEFDQRLESQGRSLQVMNSSIAQSDELLERVLDLVQNLSPATPEPREPLSIS